MRAAIAGARTRRVAGTVLVAIVVALGVVRVAGYWSYTQGTYRIDNDFTPDYVSARAWLDGEDPYGPLAAMYRERFGETPGLAFEPTQLNPHPPILIVLASPLARLGIGGARAAVWVVSIASILVAVFLFCRGLGMRRPAAAAAAVVVLSLPMVAYEVRWAQTGGVILLAIVLGWRALSAGGERRAGVALGIAAALKVYPWLLVVPLLRGRRYHAAAWMGGTAAALTVAGVIALGPAATMRFVTEASPRNVEAWGAAPHAISLAGLPYRLAAPDRWLQPGVEIAAWIPLAAAVLIVACVLAAARTRAAISDDLLWATVPWMILASPIAWPHYLVTAIPLGILLAVRSRSLDPPARALVLLSLGILGVLAPFNEWIPLDYGSVVAGTAVLVTALLVLAAADARGPLSNRAPARPGGTAAPFRSAHGPRAASSTPAPLRPGSPAAAFAERGRV